MAIAQSGRYANGNILSHTPLDQMKQIGIELYTANQDAIKAAFL